MIEALGFIGFIGMIFAAALPIAIIKMIFAPSPRKCPHCREEVKQHASVCKHCHRDLPTKDEEKAAELKNRKDWSTRWD